MMCRYLAGIGEVFYYDDAALRDYVVLDPQWLTVDTLGSLLSPDLENLKSVYAMLGIEPRADGLLSRTDLSTVIQMSARERQALSADDVGHVIDFLCRLEVAVDQQDRYLIPALLEVWARVVMLDVLDSAAWMDMASAGIRRRLHGPTACSGKRTVHIPARVLSAAADQGAPGQHPVTFQIHVLFRTGPGQAVMPYVWKNGMYYAMVDSGVQIE
jgi:hypothetical protein